MRIKDIPDQELKRVSRYSFIALIGLSFVYILLVNTQARDIIVYAFFVAYAIFIFSTAILDRRKKQQAKANQSATGEVYSTLSGAALLFMGILGLLIAGSLVFSLF